MSSTSSRLSGMLSMVGVVCAAAGAAAQGTAADYARANALRDRYEAAATDIATAKEPNAAAR